VVLTRASASADAATTVETMEVDVVLQRPLGFVFREGPAGAKGVVVTELVAGGNAEKTGLVKVGDVLLAAGVPGGGAPNDLTGDDMDAVFDKLKMYPNINKMRLVLLRSAGLEPGQFEVELKRPLNIVIQSAVQTGPKTGVGAMVSEVVPEGNAAMDGRVKVGDVMIACGAKGFPLNMVTADEMKMVYTKLQFNPEVPTMVLRFGRPAGAVAEVEEEDPLKKHMMRSRKIALSGTEYIEVELARPLGMILKPPAVHHKYIMPGAVVDGIIKGGAADQNGQLKDGDILLAVGLPGGNMSEVGDDDMDLIIDKISAHPDAPTIKLKFKRYLD